MSLFQKSTFCSFFSVILGGIGFQGSLCTAVAHVWNYHCVIFEAAIAEQSGTLRAVSVQQHRSGARLGSGWLGMVVPVLLRPQWGSGEGVGATVRVPKRHPGCRVGAGRGRCSFPKNRIPPTVIYFVDFQITPASSFSTLSQ